MQIGVIGCGRWGTFIAWYLHKIGHGVTLYGRGDSPRMRTLMAQRNNGLVALSGEIHLTTELGEALANDAVVISIGAQGLPALMEEIAPLANADAIFVLCMKGLIADTCARLSEAVQARMPRARVAVWLGPGHVQEFVMGVPNCMVIDSLDGDLRRALVDAFMSDLIRFYYGEDLLGNEIGAASKNVIGIAAGILDGLGLSTLKGALTARGTREISRLIDAMGGNPLCAYGLCHLGDYGATVFSPYSHNRRFGEAHVTGGQVDGLAEGATTVCALVKLSDKHHVDLPICRAVYETLYLGRTAREALGALFARSLKAEF